ncbi:unnamed protein product [Protopolystoma xenopodis]|uniref:Transmembrane protein n=1 Tax=Protopolystoma xenopodis TaxID=117903 RepID=A0A3S5APJ4_9PLAT|nr:unnamed protein product [Protopolystoma xenopodis]
MEGATQCSDGPSQFRQLLVKLIGLCLSNQVFWLHRKYFVQTGTAQTGQKLVNLFCRQRNDAPLCRCLSHDNVTRNHETSGQGETSSPVGVGTILQSPLHDSRLPDSRQVISQPPHLFRETVQSLFRRRSIRAIESLDNRHFGWNDLVRKAHFPLFTQKRGLFRRRHGHRSRGQTCRSVVVSSPRQFQPRRAVRGDEEETESGHLTSPREHFLFCFVHRSCPLCGRHGVVGRFSLSGRPRQPATASSLTLASWLALAGRTATTSTQKRLALPTTHTLYFTFHSPPAQRERERVSNESVHKVGRYKKLIERMKTKMVCGLLCVCSLLSLYASCLTLFLQHALRLELVSKRQGERREYRLEWYRCGGRSRVK